MSPCRRVLQVGLDDPGRSATTSHAASRRRVGPPPPRHASALHRACSSRSKGCHMARRQCCGTSRMARVSSSNRQRGNLCAIQRQMGHDQLPSACRHFPRVVVLDPRGTFITLSHVCPTAARMLIAGGSGGGGDGRDRLRRARPLGGARRARCPSTAAAARRAVGLGRVGCLGTRDARTSGAPHASRRTRARRHWKHAVRRVARVAAGGGVAHRRGRSGALDVADRASDASRVLQPSRAGAARPGSGAGRPSPASNR